MIIKNRMASKIDNSIKYSVIQNNQFSEAIYYVSNSKRIIGICISTQYGCAMGCKFCANSLNTFESNISMEAMLDITNIIELDLKENNLDLPNTYDLKGIGEPLMNLDNIVSFYKEAIKKEHIKNLSLATCGVVDNITRLASIKDVNYELYLSLHSPFQNEREFIMSSAKRFRLENILNSCRDYFNKKGDKSIVASYLLLDGINDTKRHLEEMVRILDSNIFRIEILLYNQVNNADFIRVSNEKAYQFRDYFISKNFKTDVIISKGRDINGGCGQLRNTYVNSHQST